MKVQYAHLPGLRKGSTVIGIIAILTGATLVLSGAAGEPTPPTAGLTTTAPVLAQQPPNPVVLSPKLTTVEPVLTARPVVADMPVITTKPVLAAKTITTSATVMSATERSLATNPAKAPAPPKAPTKPPAKSAAKTVVSLTFDDTNADQMTAVTTMRALGLHGTFYAITGSIGAPNYLTLAQLRTIYANGNEIGGHTVNHPDLTLVPADEATRQVCQARNTLTGWGFPQTSFAYPYASVNASVESIVKACGYNSARGLGDAQTPAADGAADCAGCPYAETMPPADPYALLAPDEIDDTWTLADLQKTVTNAQSHGGGWVILTFHHICTSGNDLCVSPSLFAQFATWLKLTTVLTPSTTVQTVQQVIGGAVQPVVAPPAPPLVAGAITNASLQTPSLDGGIECWTPYQYGTNTATFTPVSPGHNSTAADQVTMSGYSDGAAGLYPTFDTGGCTPSASPGHTYTVSGWYKSNTVTQFVVYYRDVAGGFDYWTSSPYFPASATWSQAVWTTPALPAGASGISFGLSIFSNGVLTTSDYGFVDSATLPPPITAAMANASLETAVNGAPACWTPSSYGTNNAAFTETSPGHTGSEAETVTIGTYTNGAAQLLPTMYGSSCAPAAVAGQTYDLSAWYQSTANTQFAVYYLAADGTWTYWTSSPWLAPSATWTQATWTTPALPAGATRIAFGLSLFSVGTLTTDDYGFAATG